MDQSGGSATPAVLKHQIVREAPGIEETKTRVNGPCETSRWNNLLILPDYQVAGLGALEQQGLTAAGTTGVGAGTVQSRYSIKLHAAAAPVGATTNKSIFKSISKLCNR